MLRCGYVCGLRVIDDFAVKTVNLNDRCRRRTGVVARREVQSHPFIEISRDAERVATSAPRDLTLDLLSELARCKDIQRNAQHPERLHLF